MKFKGWIGAWRSQNSIGPDMVTITVTDQTSRTEPIEIALTVEDFGRLLFPVDNGAECDVEIHENAPIGKVYEHKTEMVWVPKHDHKHREAVAAAAVEALETDGWRGRVSDATNRHNHVKSRPDGSMAYTVHFGRYVDPKDKA